MGNAEGLAQSRQRFGSSQDCKTAFTRREGRAEEPGCMQERTESLSVAPALDTTSWEGGMRVESNGVNG